MCKSMLESYQYLEHMLCNRILPQTFVFIFISQLALASFSKLVVKQSNYEVFRQNVMAKHGTLNLYTVYLILCYDLYYLPPNVCNIISYLEYYLHSRIKIEIFFYTCYLHWTSLSMGRTSALALWSERIFNQVWRLFWLLPYRF